MTAAQSTLTLKAVVLNILYLPIVSLMVWLELPVEQVLILTVLLGIDYVTVILKVYAIKGCIKSYRMIAGILTKSMILLLIFTLAFMAKGIALDFAVYLSTLISLLIISETYSIVGNIYSIKTGEDTKEFDAVAMIIKRVRKFIEKMLLANRNI